MRVCKTLIDLSLLSLTPNSCFLPHQTAAQGGGRRPPPSSPRASPPFTLFVSFAGVRGCSGVRSGIVTSGQRVSNRLWDRRHTTGTRQFGCYVLGCFAGGFWSCFQSLPYPDLLRLLLCSGLALAIVVAALSSSPLLARSCCLGDRPRSSSIGRIGCCLTARSDLVAHGGVVFGPPPALSPWLERFLA